MNLLDLGILLLLALVTVRGYYRGLFQELAVLVGVVGGVVAAAHGYLPVAGKLKPLISNPFHARWLAFAVILVVVYWLTRLFAHLLQRLLYHLYLDIFDRLLGGFFALVKGGLFVGFALLLAALVVPRNSQLFKESRTAPHLMHFSRQALDLLPPDFKQRLQDYLREWQKPKKKPEVQGAPGVGASSLPLGGSPGSGQPPERGRIPAGPCRSDPRGGGQPGPGTAPLPDSLVFP